MIGWHMSVFDRWEELAVGKLLFSVQCECDWLSTRLSLTGGRSLL